MKRFIPLVFLILPAALFAQGPKEQETAFLKRLGLNDSQVTQILDIQNRTRATIRQDRVDLQLLHAQMEKALLPSNPNMQEVNGYIAQMAQTHADLMKTSLSARIQLRQIIGDDNLPVYSRYMKHRYDVRGLQGTDGQEDRMQGGMMGGDGAGGSMMNGGISSMMGGSMMAGSDDEE